MQLTIASTGAADNAEREANVSYRRPVTLSVRLRNMWMSDNDNTPGDR